MKRPDMSTGEAFEHYAAFAISNGYLPTNKTGVADEARFVRRLVLDRRMPDEFLMPLVRMVFLQDHYREHFPKGGLPRELRVRDYLYAATVRWFQATRPVVPLTDAEAIRILAKLTGYHATTIYRALQIDPLPLQR